MAELAPAHGARVDFVSVPERTFPLALLDAPAVLEVARNLRPDVVVLDSIAAAFLGPRLARRGLGLPLVGMLHQPPGGIDHDGTRRVVQVVLDRLAYRTAELLLVASESLADELVAAGVGSDRLRVVPPGRDPAVSGRAPGGDLRRGAR